MGLVAVRRRLCGLGSSAAYGGVRFQRRNPPRRAVAGCRDSAARLHLRFRTRIPGAAGRPLRGASDAEPGSLAPRPQRDELHGDQQPGDQPRRRGERDRARRATPGAALPGLRGEQPRLGRSLQGSASDLPPADREAPLDRHRGSQ